MAFASTLSRWSFCAEGASLPDGRQAPLAETRADRGRRPSLRMRSIAVGLNQTPVRQFLRLIKPSDAIASLVQT